MIAFSSCKKEGLEDNQQSEQVVEHNYKTPNRESSGTVIKRFEPRLEEVESRIDAFLAKMNQQTVTRSSELIELSEAVWDLEASLNYNNADSYENTGKVESNLVDYPITPIDVDGTKYLDLSIVQQFYNQYMELIPQTKGESKDFYVLDVEALIDKNGDYQLRFDIWVGDPINMENVAPPFYGEWYHSDQLGRCNNATPSLPFTGTVNDTGEILEVWVNSSKTQINSASSIAKPYCGMQNISYHSISSETDFGPWTGSWNTILYPFPFSTQCPDCCESLSWMTDFRDQRIGVFQEFVSVGNYSNKHFLGGLHGQWTQIGFPCQNMSQSFNWETSHYYQNVKYGIPVCAGTAS